MLGTTINPLFNFPARQNNQTFPTEEEELRELIYKYETKTFGLKDKTSFVQIYLFKN